VALNSLCCAGKIDVSNSIFQKSSYNLIGKSEIRVTRSLFEALFVWEGSFISPIVFFKYMRLIK